MIWMEKMLGSHDVNPEAVIPFEALINTRRATIREL